MALADLTVSINTELSIGDLADQVVSAVITEISRDRAPEALAEVVKLIAANYSGYARYGDFIDGVYRAFKDDFVSLNLIPDPAER
jgi:hypothetical protein